MLQELSLSYLLTTSLFAINQAIMTYHLYFSINSYLIHRSLSYKCSSRNSGMANPNARVTSKGEILSQPRHKGLEKQTRKIKL